MAENSFFPLHLGTQFKILSSSGARKMNKQDCRCPSVRHTLASPAPPQCQKMSPKLETLHDITDCSCVRMARFQSYHQCLSKNPFLCKTASSVLRRPLNVLQCLFIALHNMLDMLLFAVEWMFREIQQLVSEIERFVHGNSTKCIWRNIFDRGLF